MPMARGRGCGGFRGALRIGVGLDIATHCTALQVQMAGDGSLAPALLMEDMDGGKAVAFIG